MKASSSFRPKPLKPLWNQTRLPKPGSHLELQSRSFKIWGFKTRKAPNCSRCRSLQSMSPILICSTILVILSQTKVFKKFRWILENLTRSKFWWIIMTHRSRFRSNYSKGTYLEKMKKSTYSIQMDLKNRRIRIELDKHNNNNFRICQKRWRSRMSIFQHILKTPEILSPGGQQNPRTNLSTRRRP